MRVLPCLSAGLGALTFQTDLLISKAGIFLHEGSLHTAMMLAHGCFNLMVGFFFEMIWGNHQKFLASADARVALSFSKS